MMIRRRAFSLAEILIVISIIVLLLALAVPAFNLISGSKSEGLANNQISALLGQARARAIGLQEVTGVFFFPSPTSGRYIASVVHSPPAPVYLGGATYQNGEYVEYNSFYYICISLTTTNALPTNTTNWRRVGTTAAQAVLGQFVLDLVPDTDSATLPSGVAMQLLCDSKRNTGASGNATDAYLRAGAILFDSNGRLIDRQIFVSCVGALGNSMGLAASTVNDDYPAAGSNCLNPVNPQFESSFGYVLYDRDALASQSYSSANDFNVIYPGVPTVTSQSDEFQGNDASSQPITSEETWLDRNSLAVLVNRYNGTLLKSE